MAAVAVAGIRIISEQCVVQKRGTFYVPLFYKLVIRLISVLPKFDTFHIKIVYWRFHISHANTKKLPNLHYGYEDAIANNCMYHLGNQNIFELKKLRSNISKLLNLSQNL